MYLIGYLCNMEVHIRNVYWTAEFAQFYNGLSDKVKAKFDYVLGYRTVMFTMDNENVMLATEITLLNAFMKKSTRDYQKQIRIAENILERISHEED